MKTSFKVKQGQGSKSIQHNVTIELGGQSKSSRTQIMKDTIYPRLVLLEHKMNTNGRTKVELN